MPSLFLGNIITSPLILPPSTGSYRGRHRDMPQIDEHLCKDVLMKTKRVVAEKTVQSTKGKKPDVLVGKVRDSKIKVSEAGRISLEDSKLSVKSASDIQSKSSDKSIVLRSSEYPVLAYVNGDLDHLPTIISELAGMRPSDQKAFNVLEQMILRDGVTAPLITSQIDGEHILMDGHMRLECIIKHKIKEFKIVILDIPSIEAAEWWTIENSNSYRQLNKFQRIEMAVKAEPHYKKLAQEHQKLAGKHKSALSKLGKTFKPIDCLKIISGQSKAGRTTVSNAKYILKYGSPEDIEKCRNGKAISSVYKDVKEKRRRSEAYQEEKNAGYDNNEFVNPDETDYINTIKQGNVTDVIRDMQFNGVKDVAAMITSPVYNIGLNYGPEVEDSLPHDEYIDWLGNTLYESSKLGRDGMRLVYVFPMTTDQKRCKGTDYKHSLLADLIYKVKELNSKHDDCNLLFWGHFNWYKNHAGGRTCQGSVSCSSPVLRVDSEYIGVWVKNTKKLENIHGTDCKPRKSNLFSEADRDKYVITPQEYTKYTLQTWQISPVHDHKHRHPARFPIEIPHRLIKLFTYPQDTIIDPFSGSGTTCVAAKLLKRNYLGIDKVAGYCQLSQDRLAELDREGGAA